MPDNPRIEELRRRVESDPASIAFAALAEEYRRTGRHEEAIEICRTGLQRHPAYLSARVTLGRALIEVGDFEGARAELETVLQSAPENLAAIRGLAQIHERLGHSAEMHPDLAALAAQPLPVKEPPAQDLRAPAPNDAPHAVEEPLAAAMTQPLKINLPDAAGGHTDLEIDLPTPSAVHQTLEVDLRLEGGATEGFDIDIPAGPERDDETQSGVGAAQSDAPIPVSVAAPSSVADSRPEPALERLERFLVGVQQARRSLDDAAGSSRSVGGGGR